MIRFKDGVNVDELHPFIWLAIHRSDVIFDCFGFDLVITSGRDGEHMSNSLHHVGFAVDFRLPEMCDDDMEDFVERLRYFLGGYYDVVLEEDHIHVEFDPD